MAVTTPIQAKIARFCRPFSVMVVVAVTIIVSMIRVSWISVAVAEVMPTEETKHRLSRPFDVAVSQPVALHTGSKAVS